MDCALRMWSFCPSGAHPSQANVDKTSEAALRVTQGLQSISTDAFAFSRCSVKHTLRDFYRYVTCPTRRDKTLDLCYGSINKAHRVLQREKPFTNRIRVWTEAVRVHGRVPPVGTSWSNCTPTVTHG